MLWLTIMLLVSVDSLLFVDLMSGENKVIDADSDTKNGSAIASSVGKLAETRRGYMAILKLPPRPPRGFCGCAMCIKHKQRVDLQCVRCGNDTTATEETAVNLLNGRRPKMSAFDKGHRDNGKCSGVNALICIACQNKCEIAAPGILSTCVSRMYRRSRLHF